MPRGRFGVVAMPFSSVVIVATGLPIGCTIVPSIEVKSNLPTSSMIYQGGQTVTTILVNQSQLYLFGEDSKPEDTTSTEKIFPLIEYSNVVPSIEVKSNLPTSLPSSVPFTGCKTVESG